MEIQKLKEIREIINNPIVQDIQRIQEQFTQTHDSAVALLDSFKSVYDPDTDMWTKWCMENMLQEERDYIMGLYKAIRLLLDNAK